MKYGMLGNGRWKFLVYLPALAAAIAVIGIIIAFKKNVDVLKEQPESIAKCQQNLFIGSAISEAIPLVLIVIGFTQLESVSSLDELYVPFVIVVGLILFSITYILLQSRIDVDEQSRGVVFQFGLISVALANAIPIISLVMLFLMVP